MDDDLRRRVEALEKEVEMLKSWRPVEATTPAAPAVSQPPPVQPPATPGKPAWRLGSLTGNQADLESRIGGKWLAIAGITLLVVAVIIFFQLAVARGWIGLAAQIAIGVLFGLALWGAGVVMAARHTLTGFAQVVSAGGVAIAAFAVFIGHHVAEYQAATGLSLLADSILLGVLGLGAAFDAGLRRVPVQAGTAAGLVIWTSIAGIDATGFSLGYAVAMAAALLAVGVWRGWPWMAATAAPAAAVVFSVHLIEGTQPWAIFGCVALVHAFIVAAAPRLRDIDAGTVVGHVISWVSFWILGGLALVEATDSRNFPWWSFAVAGLGYGASFIVTPRSLRLAAAIPATVAAIAAPLFMENEAWRIPVWFVLFVGAEALRRFKHWTTSLSVRPILLAMILLQAVNAAFGNIELRRGPWVLETLILVLCAAAAVVAWQGERRGKGQGLILPLLNLGLGILLLLMTADVLLDGPAVSVVWAVLAIALVVSGFVFNEAQLRVAGLVVFAFVLVRIVVIDLDGVDAIWRVLAFMGIAALLLLASWLYVRNAAKATNE